MPTGIFENPVSRTVDRADLVNERLRIRLVNRVFNDVEFQQHSAGLALGDQHRLAARVIDQALEFLLFLADDRGVGTSYAPSPLVDVGWHAFILHTREYHAFCQRIAGHFIHHDPVDDLAGEGVVPLSVPETVAAMTVAGFAVDDSIWGGLRKKGKGKGKGGGGSGGGGGGGGGGGDGGGGDSGGGGCGGGGGGGGCGGG